MRSDQDHSACFLLSCCFPIYPTTSIMTVLLQRSRSWKCSECGLDTTLTRCSGRLFWTQTLSKSAVVDALKNQLSNSVPRICWWLDICVLFWKHDLKNLWETWMQMSSSYQTSVVSSDRFLKLKQLDYPWRSHYPERGIVFCFIYYMSYHLWRRR